MEPPETDRAPNRGPRALRKPPAELQRIRGWLIWRYEQRPGDPKPRKVPFYAGTGTRRAGRQGAVEDSSQLATFNEAQAAAAKLKADGVGLAVLPAFGIVALDFDNCMADGKLRDDVADLVAETYAEVSPSGRGVRAFFKGALKSRKSFARQGFAFDAEFFGDSGFVTYTGQVLDTCALLGNEDTVAELTPGILELYEERGGPAATPSPARGEARDPLDTFEPVVGLSIEQMRGALAKLDPDMPEPDWVKVGWALHHETSGGDEGLALWHEWSSGALAPGGAGSSKYDERAADEKWSYAGRQGGAPVTFRSVLKLAKDAEATVAKAARRQRFAEVPVAEFVNRAPPSWLIKGLLPNAMLAMMYGESGSGKSFLALEMACAIARGVTWRGFRVRKGRVVYVAAEGAGGLRNRLLAYCSDQGVDTGALAGLTVIAAAPNLLTLDDAGALIESIKERGLADLVILDTLAQVSPGANENAGEDMGKVIRHCAELHRETGALVLLVHHAGKDPTRGARGWSGIKAACDAELEILRAGESRSLRVSKMKDGEDGIEFGFRLVQVTLGASADGDAITSCVVREAEIARKTPAKGKWQAAVWQVLADIGGLADGGGMPRNGLIDAAVARITLPPGAKDRRREYASQGLDALLDKGVLAEVNGLVAYA